MGPYVQYLLLFYRILLQSNIQDHLSAQRSIYLLICWFLIARSKRLLIDYANFPCSYWLQTTCGFLWQKVVLPVS
jgi:hypothetical protein